MVLNAYLFSKTDDESEKQIKVRVKSDETNLKL